MKKKMDLKLIEMKVKNLSLSSSIVNVTDVRAKVEIRYEYLEFTKKAKLNYDINVVYKDAVVINMGLSYLVNEIIQNSDLEETLSQAVEELGERVEIILAMVCEEIGLELI